MSSTPTSTWDQRERLLSPGGIRAFVLVTGLFFLWGIPNNLNDVLIRQFMKSFGVSLMMIIIGGAVGTSLMGFIAEQADIQPSQTVFHYSGTLNWALYRFT